MTAEKSRWFEDVAGREIDAAVEALLPEVVAAAQERGPNRDIWVRLPDDRSRTRKRIQELLTEMA